MADSIIRGQTVSITSTVMIDGVGIDISGAVEIVTMVKVNPRDADGAAVLTKKLSTGGITKTQPTLGICVTLLTATDTNGLTTENKFYYETVCKMGDGITQIRSGINELNLLGNVLKTLP